MKRSLLIVTVLVIAVIAWYGYSQYNRTNEDLKNKKAEYSINDLDLIAAFERDTASSSKMYVDKVVAVTGSIKKIEDAEAPVVLFLGDKQQMSSVICSMDSSYSASYAKLKEGTKITIKGLCIGYSFDELLGTDVKLNRCVIQD